MSKFLRIYRPKVSESSATFINLRYDDTYHQFATEPETSGRPHQLSALGFPRSLAALVTISVRLIVSKGNHERESLL